MKHDTTNLLAFIREQPEHRASIPVLHAAFPGDDLTSRIASLMAQGKLARVGVRDRHGNIEGFYAVRTGA